MIEGSQEVPLQPYFRLVKLEQLDTVPFALVLMTIRPEPGAPSIGTFSAEVRIPLHGHRTMTLDQLEKKCIDLAKSILPDRAAPDMLRRT